ncbi:MAG: hypothetical protein FJZ43_04500 [Candidatus Staskawiczbacteria bacterium]|nr:hypothetical protein [Candidatus Staskawiczbacteria bacterium]
MNKLIKTVSILAIGIFILLFPLQVATACPNNLRCSNFTNSDKRADCNYIWSQTSGPERREAVCILWNQEYRFEGQQNPNYPQAQANFAFSLSEIDVSRFILFFKVVILLLFNYILFSFLTKTSFFRKCLVD